MSVGLAVYRSQLAIVTPSSSIYTLRSFPSFIKSNLRCFFGTLQAYSNAMAGDRNGSTITDSSRAFKPLTDGGFLDEEDIQVCLVKASLTTSDLQ